MTDIKHLVASVDIKDVIRWLGLDIDRTGRIRCPNPEHTDKTPSCYVYGKEKGNKCFCFVCRQRYDALNLVRMVHNVDTKTAIEQLCVFAGGRERFDVGETAPKILLSSDELHLIGVTESREMLEREKERNPREFYQRLADCASKTKECIQQRMHRAGEDNDFTAEQKQRLIDALRKQSAAVYDILRLIKRVAKRDGYVV